jgi:UDP-glucose 4-epimerase
MDDRILLTGGAGYIGSHVLRQLRQRGEQVIVVDNLSTGFAKSLLGAPLTIADVGDRERIGEQLRQHRVSTVMHFAAHTVVPESVRDPLKYYANNTCGTRNLLAACVETGVRNFVFSSTAAVYGMPSSGVADETTTPAPINPYGRSKLMSELMLADAADASGMRFVALRYFNVAGADLEGRIGQSTPNATHLIKVACQHALGMRESVAIFGTDYDTPDGTGIRDYIHVEDLADAHLRALDYLRDGGPSVTLNCGYGRGFSVREVLDAVARVSARTLDVIEGPRRDGDPPRVVARADRLRSLLDWRPRHDELELIVRTALAWERQLAAGVLA